MMTPGCGRGGRATTVNAQDIARSPVSAWVQPLASSGPLAAIDDAPVRVIDSRAMGLLQMGRFEEAKVACDQDPADVPKLAPSLYERGLARLALNDQGGQADIDRAKALDVDASEAFDVFLAAHPGLAH